ncbi:MAG: hypothetical protein IPK23_14060 [Rhizobiales bacterium]|nr:hypothetical protein [Hyphomicrobiales bacterium]
MPDQKTDAYELQLDAMRQIMTALKPLDKEGQLAVLSWVDSQIGRVAIQPQVNEQVQRADVASGSKRPGTVSGVAQKLGANSCRTLLASAATYLTLYQAKDSFSRDELIASAKEARSWKAEYSNQMATQINRLLDAGTLFEKSKDVFSLSEDHIKDVSAKLGAA